MSSAIDHFYRFGEFTVDGNQKVLLRDGRPLPRAPKVFDTLLILVDNSGKIGAKQELMRRPSSMAAQAFEQQIFGVPSIGFAQCSSTFSERVIENEVCNSIPQSNSFSFIKAPVDTEIDPTLTVLFLGFRK